ncbi:MAG: OsmC family protein [Gammaproteobacteria bacterium]|nr:OsmC family protein [Gammaproteobacteria bacterium]
MQTSLKWAGGAAFVGRTPSGHQIIVDGPPEGGGRDLGPRPMETLLLGMGACAGYDVISILGKARQAVDDCRVDIRAERAETDPKVFTEIHVHFTLIGRDLDAKRVERAIQLSAEKYCSASIMLGKTARITHSFDIQRTAE